ncbi:amino acid adenylation domain-containing protein [Bacillus mycoides]|uniref:amino acid adenylation domain-containing protein n=1 Tax=Bacillus mycoides TaxID=1405 RepID=UPI00339D124C
MDVQTKLPLRRSQQVFELSKQETDVLEDVNKVYNTETRELILTALAMTINNWTKEENILINLESNGREQWQNWTDVSRTVGCFSSQCPVNLKTCNNIAETIKYTKDMVRRIPDNGMSYGINKYLSKERLNVTLKPEIQFKYVGQEEPSTKDSMFKIVRRDYNHEFYPLNFLGIIKEGSLQISVTYCSEEFNDETIKKLMEHFEESFCSIVNHCMKKEDRDITISDLTDEDITFEELGTYQDRLGNIERIYPLAPMQEGMLYHALLDEKDPYNIVSSLQLEGSIDVKLLEKALNKVVDRHDILRTVFDYVSFKQNMQVVFKNRKADFKYLDISNRNENKKELIDALIKQYKVERFNLSTDILIKLVLVKMKENHYCIIFNTHHILIDGWCISIIVNELFKIYNELKYGFNADLRDVKPFSDYIAWLKNKDLKDAKEFWRNYLKESNHAVNFPFETENETNEVVKKELCLSLDDKRTRFIEELARKNKVSLNTVLQCIWAILLQKYGNVEDIVYGYVVSGRSAEIEEVENILGLFINTVPLRVRITDDIQFTELLQTVNRRILKNSKYDYLSLAEIQNLSELKNELINSLFVFENFPLDVNELKEEIQRNNELKLLNDDNSMFSNTVIDETNYNFTVTVTPNKKMEIKFLYNEKVYSTENVSKIKNSFEWIINQVIQDSFIKIQDIDLINPEEKNQILFTFNETKTGYPKNKTVAELFEEQVKKTPNNTAVVFQNESLTYRELNQKANKLAHTLIKEGVGRNHIVGILVERSLEMVIGALAILKAGGAYLPIDPDYPEDRINYMLLDSQVHTLLTDGNNRIVGLDGLKVLNVINEMNYSDNVNDPKKTNNANSRAYVIYTSGTTGKPKGVEVTQKSIIRLVKETNYIDIREDDRLLQTGSIAFDASTFEVWGSLLNGAALYITNQYTVIDYNLLDKYLKTNKITIMFLTTALFHKICEVNPTTFSELRSLLVGGETLNPKYVNRILKKVPDLKLANVYGPTENTTFSTAYRINSPLDETKLIPIGIPISNTTAYILDSNSCMVPMGMDGELCLSGDGLAVGYINNEALTNKKFVDNPYLTGQKMYRTGDRARWLPDGNIEFLGRIDQQIKIRGFRIEPGEIENTLLKIKGVKEAAVVCIEEQDNKYLCAYYSSEKDYREEEIRDELKKYLPDFMIPVWFRKMNSLPLTSNGKIDKKQLPTPDRYTDRGGNYEAPRNKAEMVLASVWENVLGVKKIGINEKFFNLGGDSIKAIQVIARMRNEGYYFELKYLAANPTIKELMEYVKQNDKDIDQGEVKGTIELTPIQKWFFKQNKLVKNHFNQELMLYSKDGFCQQWVQVAFDAIVKHHDILRTVFTDGEQRIKGITEKLYDLVVYDLTGRQVPNDEITDLCTDLQASIDLEKGPLIKLGLFKTDKGDHLLIAIHHLIVDAVSWRIIVEDFDNIYSGLKNEKETVLPSKTTSFKEWSARQKEFAASYQMKKELEYWKRLSAHDIKKLKPNCESQNLTGHTMCKKTVVLERVFTDKLLTKVNRAYSTETIDIILAALVMTLGKFNQSNELLLNLESHGREQIIDNVDITRTVGWFTSLYPVFLNNSEHLGELIAGTKDTLRNIPNKGIGYGILKYLAAYDIGKSMNPDVSFNYLGHFDHIISGENFTLSEISGGDSSSKDSTRLYPLDFVGFVLNGEFNLTLNYSKEEFNDESIERLLQEYLDHIKLIISHCVSKETVEVTVTDITDEEISPEELEPYQDVIGNIKSIYPLSPMQEGLAFHSLSESGEAYHVSMKLKITGDLNVEILNKSFQELVARYDIFRTNFDFRNFSENMQVVYKNRVSKLQYSDLRAVKGNKEHYIENLIKEDRKRGFDLAKDNLIRLFVVRLDEKEFVLILSNHHIILDGWSFGIISKELFEIYNNYIMGAPKSSEKVTPYKEYIEWLKGQDKDKALRFWSEYLNGYNNHIEIPFKKSPVSLGRPQEVIWNLGKQRTIQLEAFARSNNVTVNTILQSIWAILLQRYNNVRDVVFGFIVSGRTTKITQIDEMVGLFINTIPLRVNTNVEKRYKEIIKKIKADFDENELYRYVSIAEIQKNTEVKSGLINTLMVFENYPIDKNLINDGILEKAGIEIGEPQSYEETNYSFNLKVISGEEHTIVFDYNDGAYDKEAVLNIKNHFAGILDQIMKNPEIMINELELSDDEERKVLLEDFNNTYVQLDKKSTIQDLFEYQATKNPDKPAIVYGDKTMSYGELNRRSGSLAQLLRRKGIGSETIVPVMADKSFEMVIGILAVLKAGAAYLPIDMEYPEERINYILKDSRAKIMITTRKSLQNRELNISELIYLEDQELYVSEVEKIENKSNPNSLAYVIYTSGTTGKPKGVLIEQKGVINLTHWFKQELGISGHENILQFASIAFDAFSWELYMTLLLGNTLFIPDKDVILSPDLLNDYIRRNHITTLTLPPFVAADLESENDLKRVIVAGSEVKMSQIKHLLGQIEVINAYGPTEDTVCTTYYKLPDAMIEATIPIGKPISNHKVIIMDDDNKLVPVGVEGELCISGVGLARGYLNNEILTKEKFIENPYKKGETLYKTGDTARRLLDGNIEYLGRNDHQVKVRGFRIEMNEIEQHMLEIPSVSQVTVIDKEIDGMKYVCAYFVSKEEIGVNMIRETLMKTLPQYMIPSYFIKLEKIPFNINGKVDRKNLPDIDTCIQVNASYDEEVNEVEQLLLDICKKVLGLKRIGVNDNLFELGADSIRIAKIYKEIKKINLEISIKDIFYYENIRSIYTNCINPELLTDKVEKVHSEVVNTNFNDIKSNLTNQINKFNDTILKAGVIKEYPTSAIQKITWETNKTYSGAIMEFNQKVNVDLLKKSIVSVINKQGLLRSILIMSDGDMKIEEHDIVENMNIPYLNLEGVNENLKKQVMDFIIGELYRENLENRNGMFNKLLYKMIIVKFDSTKFMVYMPFNHLIFDGMSMEIIKANIRRAYSNNGEFKEQVVCGYDTYVGQLHLGPQDVSEKELMKKFNLNYFRESFKKYDQVFKNSSFSNNTISIKLTMDIYERIKEMSWNVSINIFQKILECNFDMESIPFVMMYQDRKHKINNYYNTVGEFIDVLPLNFKKGEMFDLTQVNSLISFAREKNINFSTLLGNTHLKEQYKKINNALKGMYTDSINVPIFNYLDIYDAKEENKELGVEVERALSESGELSMEIVVTLYKDELKVNLFCEEHKKKEITEELQRYIYNLGNIPL